MSDPKVNPLRKRTMTLEQLQERTLQIIRGLNCQLRREGWEGGQTMEEFTSEASALEADILQDRGMRRESENRRLANVGFAQGPVNNPEPARCVLCGRSVTGRRAWWRTQNGKMGVFCRPCAVANLSNLEQ